VVILIITETLNAETTLFKVKTGWLNTLSGLCEKTMRDFIGEKTLDQLNQMKGSDSEKEFRKAFDNLNTIIGPMIGQKIIEASFVDYKIGEAINDSEKASISKFIANKEREGQLELAKGKAEQAKQRAKETITLADAEAYKIEKTGKAEADIILKQGEASAEAMRRMVESMGVKGKENIPAIAIAKAVENQQNAQTLILGNSGILPTINTGERQ